MNESAILDREREMEEKTELRNPKNYKFLPPGSTQFIQVAGRRTAPSGGVADTLPLTKYVDTGKIMIPGHKKQSCVDETPQATPAKELGPGWWQIKTKYPAEIIKPKCLKLEKLRLDGVINCSCEIRNCEHWVQLRKKGMLDCTCCYQPEKDSLKRRCNKEMGINTECPCHVCARARNPTKGRADYGVKEKK